MRKDTRVYNNDGERNEKSTTKMDKASH